MARNNEGIFDEVWAESGDKAQPVFPITTGWDSQYSTPISSGGLAPKRTTFNYTFNQLYALGVDVNQMGAALQWNSTITYQLGATVIGNDGLLYTSLVVGNINFDPNAGANPDKWTAITRYLELSDQTAGTEGSRLVGYNGISVYTAIGARPTFTTLAASGGAALIGTTSSAGDVQDDLDNMISSMANVYQLTPVPVYDNAKGISSITRQSGGNYTVNLSTAFSSIHYVVIGAIGATNPAGGTFSFMYKIINASQFLVALTFIPSGAENSQHEDAPFSFAALQLL